jgi:alcohol dehydrogenase-like protein
MTGLPYLIRVVVPTLELRRPKGPVRGMDLAGNVEAMGSTVTRFQPGDEVFGWTDGGFYAEYACAPEDCFARNHRTSPLRRRRPCPSPASPPSRRCGMWARSRPGLRCSSSGRRVGWGRSRSSWPRRSAPRSPGCVLHRPGRAGPLDRRRRRGRLHPRGVTDGSRHWDLIVDTAGHRSLSQLRRALAPKGDASDRRQ